MVDQSRTVADVLAQVRDGRLVDFVKEAVVLVTLELMGLRFRPRSARRWPRLSCGPPTATGIAPGRGKQGLGRSSC